MAVGGAMMGSIGYLVASNKGDFDAIEVGRKQAWYEGQVSVGWKVAIDIGF